MKEIDQNFQYFQKKYGSIYSAYENFGKMVHQQGGPLPEKTRWLIKIAISAASEYSFALRTHIKKAMDNGCTREEIEHAILLIAPSTGFPKMMEAIMILREELGD
ncbi:MAG: carboxymuconolactone decarboxylase family protein [Spirochaetes bacterium]|nr:carboxymuconolactone decarboxylase family protein [Spirochaetota bacterium]